MTTSLNVHSRLGDQATQIEKIARDWIETGDLIRAAIVQHHRVRGGSGQETES